MQKSFSVHRNYTAKELTSPSFSKKITQAAEEAVPLVKWLENSLRLKPSWNAGGR